jgi:hypothetical protein
VSWKKEPKTNKQMDWSTAKDSQSVFDLNHERKMAVEGQEEEEEGELQRRKYKEREKKRKKF